MRVADLVVDPAARRAWRGDRELELTKTEFDLLAHAGPQRRHRLHPHRRSTTRSWSYDFGPDSKTLAVYVGYLRRKLEEGGEPTADPHRAGRRLHAPGAMTLRVRLALALSLLTAIAVTAMALVGYRSTATRLYQEIDRSLSSSASASPTPTAAMPPRSAASSATNLPDDGNGGPIADLPGTAVQCLDRSGSRYAASSDGAAAHRRERRAAGRPRGRVVAAHGRPTTGS